METVQFKISEDMMRVGAMLAREEDITLGQLIRNLLAKEISRRKNARPPNRADEHLVAPLRARLAPDFAYAKTWDDLQKRLQAKGYELRPAGGGLALHRHPSGPRVCKASELGFACSKLVERFRMSFPGHAHTWIAERLGASSTTSNEEDLTVLDDDDTPRCHPRAGPGELK
jgi:CubicO group peptidase (beta-lactamase class C family)